MEEYCVERGRGCEEEAERDRNVHWNKRAEAHGPRDELSRIRMDCRCNDGLGSSDLADGFRTRADFFGTRLLERPILPFLLLSEQCLHFLDL